VHSAWHPKHVIVFADFVVGTTPARPEPLDVVAPQRGRAGTHSPMKSFNVTDGIRINLRELSMQMRPHRHALT
jgi:hypothetical protein